MYDNVLNFVMCEEAWMIVVLSCLGEEKKSEGGEVQIYLLWWNLPIRLKRAPEGIFENRKESMRKHT